ncbi:MAG: 50S ribosomal protein L3 [Candidatus Colwellbacteria bacterium RIFCSPLOWO2_01_FULL_48_10]|uniref:Large ribosomal subunit protein uL3 n=1 Tax=Candidatus Colwellbacteria bacterium RIFCSPLOWO2_01_FULL_48_10 TaxID=1797690 RepID=A0A1G1Z8L0_9BACT|nr:MAG: 50S ribosomal protein L3 [Candidatus Colwellbacteria bacterium RIFCSPLOWO2_01_FULL_48_10]
MNYIKAKKLTMSQIFKNDKVVPVTYVQILEKPEGAILKVGDILKVTGTSKGKGFQGVVKRHGFGGGPATHGQKNRQRAPGSIGNTTPQRVLPGRRMAGHMGVDTVTVKNLELVEIDEAQTKAAIKGAIPGWRGRIIKIRQ